MTTMIASWFGKPREIYDSPSFIEMSHATARLYDFILWMSDRRSSRKFDVTDEDITARTTLAKRTLAMARKDLAERGLIVWNRLPKGYTYVICDPSTGRPFPGDPKVKVPYTKKSSSPAAEQDATPPEDHLPDDEMPTAPPVLSEVTIAPAVSTNATEVMPENILDASQEGKESSFEFGWNVPPQPNVSDFNPFEENKRRF